MINSKVIRNKNIVFGQPTLQGTRLTVYDVVFGAKYDGVNEYTIDHKITTEELKECVIYCKDLLCQTDKDGEFCNGCVLSTLKKGYYFNQDELKEVTIKGEKYVFTVNGQSVFLGGLKDYQEQLFGQMGWAIAEEVYLRDFKEL